MWLMRVYNWGIFRVHLLAERLSWPAILVEWLVYVFVKSRESHEWLQEFYMIVDNCSSEIREARPGSGGE